MLIKKKLELNFLSLGENTCILLDYNITLLTILEEAIIELKNEISSNIKSNFTSQYQIPINQFKDVINVYFDKFNNDFRSNYLFYFNSFRNVLLQSTEQTKSTTYEVTSLTTLIKEGFENGLNYGLKEIENLINQNNFSKRINNKDKINEILNKIFSNIGLTIPNIGLKIMF